MSTVHETITAHHCSIKVLAFSLITNMCVTERKDYRMNKNINNNHNGIKGDDLEKEVLDAAQSRKDQLQTFMIEIVSKLSDMLGTKPQR